MCGGLQINRVSVRPGDSIKYRVLTGQRTGSFGLGKGLGAYNARIENLDKVWSKMKGNRAVVTVDSFDEKGVSFRGVGSTDLAALYDVEGNVVLLTMPAGNLIKEVHHRQPVVLEDADEWLQKGEICLREALEVAGNVTISAQTDKDARRRAFLASVIR